MPEPPPIYQLPRSEFNDLLRRVFEVEGPPHEILSFCHTFFLEGQPQGIVNQYARPGHEISLGQIADEFVAIYCSPLVEPDGLKKMMQPLMARLALSLEAATNGDSNWQSANRHVLELHAKRQCGETMLSFYDSGQLSARVAAWNRDVSSLLKRRGAVSEAERLDGLCSNEIAPFEAIGYLMRTILEDHYSKILESSQTPLRELARELEKRYYARPKPTTVPLATRAFECLHKRLEERFRRDHLRNVRKWEERYAHLMGRVLGETILKNYEMSALPDDISSWAWSIKTAVRDRYLRGPRMPE